MSGSQEGKRYSGSADYSVTSFQIALSFPDSYNIALGQHTEQSPTDYCEPKSPICHLSDLAVNGDTTGNVPGGQCAVTTGTVGKGSWWKVDFSGDYYLSLIKIFRRSDCKYVETDLKNYLPEHKANHRPRL